MMGFELDDSLKTYNPGKESHRTVLWLKERPFRAAAVCLGVLCVVLLTGIIIVAGQHNHAAVEQPTPSCNLIGEQVQLGTRCNLTDLRREQTRNKNVTKERDQLRITCTNLIQEQGQLQTRYMNLTEERDKLKTSIMQLIQERDQLQTSTNNLTQERDHLLTINKCLTKEGFQLKTSNNNLTQERDLLGTSNKYLNKEMNQLQTINNNLTQERDLLQTSNNNLSEEMYQLQTINNNLTQERDLLQTSNKNLTEAMYQLQTINNNLTQERDLLQTSKKNLTEAMYQLQTINNNVTLERDQLKELQSLSDGGGCLAGWQPHGGSCYFLSAEKKSWMASRQDCQDKGADLVVIHSEEEQNFINNFCCAVWIGLTDRGSESKWKWVDGSTRKLSLWNPGEPNNAGNEDCAELIPESKTWNDISCTWQRHWACKSVKRNSQPEIKTSMK
ncbi:CD209 antigen-like protein B [Gadus chalcogrammus]|uniref:CD209 antigen-like protein B n=1 Tax=Gadus chalcogrammus TaxID=1042646 RepID=UPI0024C4C48C|nr:CD209 antigen-like protein B [Gadus chalcogrammus]XP_056439983.1 CD209 antigen-like protein B [Gadus chalcogrammus]